MMTRLSLVFAAGCALILAACGGSTSSCSGGTFNANTIPMFVLTNPSPGAAGVPDSTDALIFSGQPESGTKIVLTAHNQTVATISTLTALPEPTSGNPTQPTQYLASLPSALSPATTYSVIYEFPEPVTPGSACGAQGYTENLGSFTTL